MQEELFSQKPALKLGLFIDGSAQFLSRVTAMIGLTPLYLRSHQAHLLQVKERYKYLTSLPFKHGVSKLEQHLKIAKSLVLKSKQLGRLYKPLNSTS
jgi:hypothetical protein